MVGRGSDCEVSKGRRTRRCSVRRFAPPESGNASPSLQTLISSPTPRATSAPFEALNYSFPWRIHPLLLLRNPLHTKRYRTPYNRGLNAAFAFWYAGPKTERRTCQGPRWTYHQPSRNNTTRCCAAIGAGSARRRAPRTASRAWSRPWPAGGMCSAET